MAARSRELRVIISGDATNLNRAFGQVEKGAGQAESRMHGFGAKVSSAFKVAGAAIAGAEIASQLKETITAAKDAEVAHARLGAQLKAVGVSYTAHAKQITEVIDKTSALSGITGKDLEGALTSVVRGTGNLKDGLHGVAIAADLARAKHMDVAKAGDLVAKVYNGNVGALKRMGISLTPVTAAQDKLKESTKHATVEQQRAAKELDKNATAHKALALLQQRVGGQAEAYGKTAAGAQDRFRAAVERLRETIGAKLLPIIAKVAGKAADFVTQMQDGTGAGGRFAAKLKAIADAMKPIVKFFTDHPKIIAVAIAAWVAYRVAAAAAMAATRLKALGMFKGLAKPAAVGGAEAGAAFGAASNTAASTRMGKFGWASLGSGIGGAIGTAAGIAMVGELAVQIGQWLKKQPWYKPPGGKGGFLDDLIPDSFFPKKKPGQHMGGLLGALGVGQGSSPVDTSGVKASPFHPSTPLGKLPKAKPRAHTSSVRAHAATAHAASASPVARAASSGRYTAPELAALWVQAGGPSSVADTAAAIALAESGGDPNIVNSIGATGLWQIHPGGSQYLPPMANAKAAVAKYKAARGFTPWTTYTGYDTPGHAKTYTQFLGQSGVTGGSTIVTVGRRAARPKITTVGLEHGQSGKPKGMGTPFPKGVTGFQAGLTTGQIADLTADPQTNQKARNMRLFQIGVRKNKIISDLRSGKVRDPATRKRLLDELASLNGEQADLLKPIGGDLTEPAALTGTAAIPGADAYLSSLDRQAAEAALTPDTADDKNVAGLQLTAAQNIYAYEKARPGQFSDADIADAARNLKTARDNADQADQATTALTDQMKALTDELKRQNDTNQHILGVTSGQWQKAFADVINGQIGGYIDSRARTAGDGSLARA